MENNSETNGGQAPLARPASAPNSPTNASPPPQPAPSPAPVQPQVTQQPQVQPGTVGQQLLSAPANPMMPTKSSKKPMLLGLVVLAILLLGGGGYALFSSVYNNPENIWDRAMSRTSAGLRTVVDRINEQNDDSRGTKVEGSIASKSGLVYDAKIAGASQGANGSYELEVGALGARVNGDIRYVTEEGTGFPDVYVRVNGVGELAPLLGVVDSNVGAIAGQIDNTWYRIDRTLAGTFISALDQAGETPMIDMQKYEGQILDLIERRILSASNEAIFTDSEYVGEEEFKGEQAHRYKITPQNDAIVALFEDIATICDEIAADLSMDGSDTMDCRESLDIDGLQEALRGEYFQQVNFEAWVASDGGYLRNVRISEINDTTGYIQLDVGVVAESGKITPQIEVVTRDTDDAEVTFSLALTASEDQSIELNGALSSADAFTPLDITFAMTAVPTDEEVSVEVPSDATSILELLGGLLNSTQPLLPNFDSGNSVDASNLDQIEL